MKIDGINSSDAHPRKASSASKGSDVSFATELAAATASEVASTPPATTPRVDFTRMTGKQLFDWASSKAKAGDISPDDSFSLQSMAVVVQPGKSIAVDTEATVDFTQQAKAGLEWAKSNGETDLASMMEANLKVMKRYQVS